MPVGMKGAPECSRAACYKKIYRRGDDGEPLCVSHYRETYDEEHPLQAGTDRTEGQR